MKIDKSMNLVIKKQTFDKSYKNRSLAKHQSKSKIYFRHLLSGPSSLLLPHSQKDKLQDMSTYQLTMLQLPQHMVILPLVILHLLHLVMDMVMNTQNIIVLPLMSLKLLRSVPQSLKLSVSLLLYPSK